MIQKLKYIVPVIIFAGIVFYLTLVTNEPKKPTSFGSVSLTVPTQVNTYKEFDFFTATTTTATSTTDGGGGLVIAGAKKVSFFFSRGDTTGTGNSGSSVFSVEVTPDGTNWHSFNKLVQNLATSTAPTTLSSITISAATSTTIASMDLEDDSFYAVRCIVNETTDGEHTCSASLEF